MSGSDGPDDIQINLRIVMHHHLTHPNDLPPWDLGMRRAEPSRDMRRGLAHNLNLADNCRVQYVIPNEGILIFAREPALNCTCGVQHMTEPDELVMLRRIAPALPRECGASVVD